MKPKRKGVTAEMWGVRFELLLPKDKRWRYVAWKVRTRAGAVGIVLWSARLKRYVFVPRLEMILTFDTLDSICAFILRKHLERTTRQIRQ
jgi:hypothetical protein